MKSLIAKLVSLANDLDLAGLTAEATEIDGFIRSFASEIETRMNAALSKAELAFGRAKTAVHSKDWPTVRKELEAVRSECGALLLALKAQPVSQPGSLMDRLRHKTP